jgi:alpha-NAC-related protein
MKAAMKKMGMQQEEIDADEVIIKLSGGEKEIVIRDPSVAKIVAMGQESFQISGEHEERTRETESTQEFNEEDVKTITEQTNVSETEAKAALAKVNGDLAAAILFLNEKESKEQ